MFQLYNSLSKTKEDFYSINPGKVGMYVCGPTVYDHCHLGHGRGYVAMDVLRRYLEYLGFEVRLIMNYTDVGHQVDNAEQGEDKVEKRARQEKINPLDLAEKYIKSCEEDFRALQIKPAHFYPRPTQYIAQIIDFIEGLIKKGYAYEANGSVYFSVDKFPQYGCLSGKRKEDLIAGARIEINPDKKSPLDFALWIKAPQGHILKWSSPWSVGYPGWHIECSVMSYDLLGQDTFDIHGGGNENAFPHNENEIAQSESYLGKKMANFWVLWNMVTVEGVKMSKSLGNFVYIKDALKKHASPVVRLWILSSHYRSPINYSEEALKQAEANLKRITELINNLKSEKLPKKSSPVLNLDTNVYQKKFEQAMDDDLNTPLALSVVYELITEANKLKQSGCLTEDNARQILDFWEKINKILGLEIHLSQETIPEEVKKIAEERLAARIKKDYKKSDELRAKIAELGYSIEDLKNNKYKITKKT